MGIETAIIAGSVAAAGIGSAAQNRAQNKAEDFARSQQEQAMAEQKRLEEKYGLTPGELERQDRTFALEKERQGVLEGRAGKTGEQLIRDQGPVTSRLLDEIGGRQGKTGEELFLGDTGEVGRQLRDNAVNFDENLYNNQLRLTLDDVNKEANRRGLYGSEQVQGNVRFENLGRAGVDLAIKSAQERQAQQSSLANAFLQLSGGARQEAGILGERALGESQQARGELQKFLNDIQTMDQSSKGRALQAAGLGAEVGAQGNQNQANLLSGIYGQQAGAGSALTEAGLKALLNVGMSQIPQKTLPTSTKKIEDFLGDSQQQDPYSGLSSITGRDLFERYSSRRNY